MYHKPSIMKRRVTHTQSFEMWQNSSSRHLVGNASRVSADFYGNRVKRSLPAARPSRQQLTNPKMGAEQKSSIRDIPEMSPLLQKQQKSEKDDLEDELRLERDEEEEKLRKVPHVNIYGQSAWFSY